MTTLRAYLPHALFILSLALFASAPAMFFHTRDAKAAGTSIPLQGYAWAGFLVSGSPNYASGPGWISFSGPGYGVSEDSSSGALSGYAWSENYGWISFDPSNADGSHPAPTVLSNGELSGWARACAALANKSDCSAGGALDSGAGGWDGWISLSGKALDNSSNPSCPDGASYCIVQSPGCATGWSGYAWGSNDIGWISASGTAGGSPYGVTCSAPLTPITASCTVSPAVGTTNTSFIWKVSSPTGGFGAPYTYSWSGSDGLSGSGTSVTKTYSTTGSKNGSVTVTDSGGSSQAFTCYAVDSSGNPISPPQSGVTVYPTPTASLTASKYTITNGQSITLTWSCGNSNTYTGNGFNSNGQTSGTASLSSASGTTLSFAPSCTPVNGAPSCDVNYGLTCSNSGGSANALATVTVKMPNITITANPTRVASGGTSIITWSSTKTNSCTITSNDTNDTNFPYTDNTVNSSGSRTSGAITKQTVFTATCQTDGNPVSAQVIVNILPVFQEF